MFWDRSWAASSPTPTGTGSAPPMRTRKRTGAPRARASQRERRTARRVPTERAARRSAAVRGAVGAGVAAGAGVVQATRAVRAARTRSPPRSKAKAKKAKDDSMPPPWDDDYFFAALPTAPTDAQDDGQGDRYGASGVAAAAPQASDAPAVSAPRSEPEAQGAPSAGDEGAAAPVIRSPGRWNEPKPFPPSTSSKKTKTSRRTGRRRRRRSCGQAETGLIIRLPARPGDHTSGKEEKKGGEEPASLPSRGPGTGPGDCGFRYQGRLPSLAGSEPGLVCQLPPTLHMSSSWVTRYQKNSPTPGLSAKTKPVVSCLSWSNSVP